MIIALDVTLGDILEIDKAGRDVRSCDFEGIHVPGFNNNFIYSMSKNVKLCKGTKYLLLLSKTNIILYIIKKL